MTTYHSISLELLQELIEPIIGEILVESLLNEKVLRDKYGSIANPKLINGGKGTGSRMDIVDTRMLFQGAAPQSDNSANGTPGVSNGANSNGNSNSAGEYFQCLNCDRKIIGSRFAAHIDKCLGGRTRK